MRARVPVSCPYLTIRLCCVCVYVDVCHTRLEFFFFHRVKFCSVFKNEKKRQKNINCDDDGYQDYRKFTSFSRSNNESKTEQNDVLMIGCYLSSHVS